MITLKNISKRFGELQVLKATGKELDVVRSYRVAEDGTWAPPVLFGNSLLVKDTNHLTRWELGDAAR